MCGDGDGPEQEEGGSERGERREVRSGRSVIMCSERMQCMIESTEQDIDVGMGWL